MVYPTYLKLENFNCLIQVYIFDRKNVKKLRHLQPKRNYQYLLHIQWYPSNPASAKHLLLTIASVIAARCALQSWRRYISVPLSCQTRPPSRRDSLA